MSKSTSPKRGHGRREHNVKEMCPVAWKVRHTARKKALTVFNQILGTDVKGRLAQSSKPTAVYKCPHCAGWHLTSKEQR
jgi:hypothetical protein